MRRILKNTKRDPVTGCWNWTAFTNPSGYGHFTVHDQSGTRSSRLAHRVVFSTVYGYNGSLHVCHQCDNPRCCNPEHLFVGTHHDNMMDKTEKDRSVKHLHPHQVVAIRERWDSTVDVNMVDLANDYGVGVGAIYGVVTGKFHKHIGGPVTECSTRQKVRRNTKVTLEQVLEIRTIFSDPANRETVKGVARRYQVTPSYIRLIVKRKVWAFI